MSFYRNDTYGFEWGPIRVRRTATLFDGSFVLTVMGYENPEMCSGRRNSEVDIYVSLNGKSIRVVPRKGRVTLRKKQP